jgi:hypothetical protein
VLIALATTVAAACQGEVALLVANLLLLLTVVTAILRRVVQLRRR